MPRSLGWPYIVGTYYMTELMPDLQTVLNLLREDKRSIAELHTATGLAYHWLRKVRAGDIRNPNYERIRTLYLKLTNA